MTERIGEQRRRLTIAGILLGLGLGGFFDGILLHQILQWHHMLSNTSEYPPNSVAGLEVNTLADGLFHASTYIFTLAGLAVLWDTVLRGPVPWSTRAFAGTLLMGWGLFNVIEGIIDHQLLGIHHVNEKVPQSQWIYWDLGFLAWGAVMLVGGWLMTRGEPAAGTAVSGRTDAGDPVIRRRDRA